jgi:hypothetical protein
LNITTAFVRSHIIEKVYLNRVTKEAMNEMHGEKSLYQIVWYFTLKAEIFKIFKRAHGFTTLV